MTNPDFHKQNTYPGLFASGKPNIPVPQVIGPYRIESLLEKGGMSILYLGTHPESRDPTTIKVLSPKYLSHPEVVRRFLDEAEIIAMADHPNIVKLFGHGEWEGGLYIAMEFIEGISLRQFILQNPVSLRRALEIIMDIAYALCHLHTHGVIHRDLKPENILITDKGQVKVIDFGIAQLLTERISPELPPKQKLIGTPIYMSPEQRDNPESVSYPTDIYSLGIVAYELILGKLSLGRIHLSLMPKGLQKILAKALQPSLELRYHDVVDFISDISAYINTSMHEQEKHAGDHISEFSENLKVAHESLAPDIPPDLTSLEIGISQHKSLQMSGNYCDFLELSEDSYGIIMGESSTVGAQAIIDTAFIKGLVRASTLFKKDPRELMHLLNEAMLKDPGNRVFTISYLILDMKASELTFLSCGYGSLWHIRDGQISKIVADNIALGIDATIDFKETRYPFKPGDMLIMHTYGAISYQDFEGHEFTEEKFLQAVMENVDEPAQKITDSLLRKVKVFSNKVYSERALSFICVRRK